jgi:hypothetical protein
MVDGGSQELALLAKAGKALARATSVEEIKVIRDKAEAVRKYAQNASLGLDLQNRAAEVKLQAERQAGSLLSELGLRGGDRRSKNHRERLKLGDLGISRNQSTRWQLQARVPEIVFREYVQQTCANGKELTSANLMRFAKRQYGVARRLPKEVSIAPLRPAVAARPSRFAAEIALRPSHSQQEIVTELLNHHETVAGIIEPLYSIESAELQPAERRALKYLMSETRLLLERLSCELSTSADREYTATAPRFEPASCHRRNGDPRPASH